ncbi:MAG: glycine zipper family protein [Burkholderiales bacterium]|jgi:hypothetical protein
MVDFTALFRDIGFIGAIIGALSGLIGAVIGGVATYLASTRQYRTEHRVRQNAALSACLLELCRNQPTLIRELDRILPLWLTRQHSSIRCAEHLSEITKSIPIIETRVFDAFFPELVSSPYGPELKTYYDRIAFINKLASAYADGIPAYQFGGYVRALALSLEVAIDIVNALNRTVSKNLPPLWGRESDFESLVADTDRTLLMTALFRVKLSDLEQKIIGQHVSSSIPERIINCDSSELFAWVAPARVLANRAI